MSKVFYSHEKDRERFTKQIMDKFANKLDGRIFIKPNIVSYEPYPTTTNPELLKIVFEYLDGHEITVGDASAVDCVGFNAEKSKLNEFCKKYGVPLVDLYSKEMRMMKTENGYKFNVSQVPLSFDSIISLPILKVHKYCQMTGALKCAFGYLSKVERIKMHTNIKNIHRGIAELNTIFKPTLTIMDGIETLLKTNEVRHGGIQHHMGMMLAGTDPVSLDCYGLKILQKYEPKLTNMKPMDIKHIKYAIELNIGNIEYELEEIK